MASHKENELSDLDQILQDTAEKIAIGITTGTPIKANTRQRVVELVLACIPEKREVEPINSRTLDGIADTAFNQCREQMITNLKERGIK